MVEREKRQISLTLSDSECDAIRMKALDAGLSVAELLENVIADLVDSKRSNGSDERMIISTYFSRCFGKYRLQYTFLQYLHHEGDLDEYIYLLQDIENVSQDIRKLESGELFSDAVWEWIKELKIDLEAYYEEQKLYYEEYLQTAEKEGYTEMNLESFEEAVKRVNEWKGKSFL